MMEMVLTLGMYKLMIDGENANNWSSNYFSISSYCNTVAVGSHGNNVNISYSGHVWVYTV